ncbi:MAG: hypothetical protein C5B57_02585 [Blastocatellia bacterium]|nr:MAG: hypothetical protein C5B57_02585 [Blastocatellia bacterium]
MNLARVAAAAVVAWIVSIPVGYVVNTFLFAGLNQANQSAMRPEADLTAKLPLGFVFLLLGFFAFAYMYAKGYEGGSGVVEGARFGLCAGTLIVGFGIIWQYIVYPITGSLAVAAVIDSIVEAVLYGAIVGAVYKPAAHAVRHAAPA